MKTMVFRYLLPYPENPLSLTTYIEAPRDFNPLSVALITVLKPEGGLMIDTRQVAVWGTCELSHDDLLETTPKCKHGFLIVPTGVEFSSTRRMRFIGTTQVVEFHVFHLLRGQ